MAKTIFQLRKDVKVLGDNVAQLSDEYQNKLVDVNATPDMIESAKNAFQDAKLRFDGMKQVLDEKEAAAEDDLKKDADKAEQVAESKGMKQVNAVAGMLRQVVSAGQKVDMNDFNQVAGVSVNGSKDAAVGDNFLPITLSNEIISEPDMPNPLRGQVSTSALVNLRVPAMDVDFGDAWGVVAEGSEAKDLAVTGNQITFSRFESKVRIGLTDALLAGTDLALMQYAQQKLANGASTLELARAFAMSAKTGEEHMSFYDASNKIAKVGGADLFEGITDALADLNDADADQAVIFMTRKDYNKIIKTLANGSTTLFGAQPEQILGAPVFFTSYAAKPVVGNFSMYHQNYDPQGSIIEQYRKPETGVTYAQYTLWYDAKVKRPSAFRIVDLSATVAPKA